VDTLRRLPERAMLAGLVAGELDPATPPRLMAEFAERRPAVS
jgi:hypothetical protein